MLAYGRPLAHFRKYQAAGMFSARAVPFWITSKPFSVKEEHEVAYCRPLAASHTPLIVYTEVILALR
jgi:hypothetical protein